MLSFSFFPRNSTNARILPIMEKCDVQKAPPTEVAPHLRTSARWNEHWFPDNPVSETGFQFALLPTGLHMGWTTKYPTASSHPMNSSGVTWANHTSVFTMVAIVLPTVICSAVRKCNLCPHAFDTIQPNRSKIALNCLSLMAVANLHPQWLAVHCCSPAAGTKNWHRPGPSGHRTPLPTCCCRTPRCGQHSGVIHLTAGGEPSGEWAALQGTQHSQRVLRRRVGNAYTTCASFAWSLQPATWSTFPLVGN